MNGVGDQPGGVGPVSPGSRMSTRARPPLTVTSGAPSALRPIATRGLLPGGAGGSAASVVMVPSSSTKRIRTVPPVTSMPPGGAEAGQRDHGRFAVLSETVGNGERRIAPGVGIHALGQGLDKCWAAIVDGLPVGIVAGLLDGLFQCLVERIGFDRYNVVVVGCVAATDGKICHCAASPVAASVAASVHTGPISTLTLPPRTTMVTVRSRGMSQKISRHTASAMVRWRASSTEHNSLSEICRASSSKRVSCVSQEDGLALRQHRRRRARRSCAGRR